MKGSMNTDPNPAKKKNEGLHHGKLNSQKHPRGSKWILEKRNKKKGHQGGYREVSKDSFIGEKIMYIFVFKQLPQKAHTYSPSAKLIFNGRLANKLQEILSK